MKMSDTEIYFDFEFLETESVNITLQNTMSAEERKEFLYLVLVLAQGDDRYGSLFAGKTEQETCHELIDAWHPEECIDDAKRYKDYQALSWILQNGSKKSKQLLIANPDAISIIVNVLQGGTKGQKGQRKQSAKIKDLRDIYILSRVHEYHRNQNLPLKNDTSVSACSKASEDHKRLINSGIRKDETLVEADGVYQIWRQRKKNPWYSVMKKSGYFEPQSVFIMSEELKQKREEALKKLRESSCKNNNQY